MTEIFLYRIDHYQTITEDGETYPAIMESKYHAPLGTKQRDEMIASYAERNDAEDYYDPKSIAVFDDEYDFPHVLRALKIADGEIRAREWEARKEQTREL